MISIITVTITIAVMLVIAVAFLAGFNTGKKICENKYDFSLDLNELKHRYTNQSEHLGRLDTMLRHLTVQKSDGQNCES
jgi:hypothetical protein